MDKKKTIIIAAASIGGLLLLWVLYQAGKSPAAAPSASGSAAALTPATNTISPTAVVASGSLAKGAQVTPAQAIASGQNYIITGSGVAIIQ